MAKFCNMCGRPLGEGETCECQKQDNELQKEKEPLERENAENDIFELLKSFGEKLGEYLDKIHYFISGNSERKSGSGKIMLRNLFGFSKEDYIEDPGDCYERGKLITPDLVQPCGQEIPIRQYDICAARSFIRGLWQEGRLQVTNKRVLFRLSGRNWVGKAQTSIEFALDEIAGVNIKRIHKLSWMSVYFNCLIASVFMGIGGFFANKALIFGMLISLMMILLTMITLKGHYRFKMMIFAYAIPNIFSYFQSNETGYMWGWLGATCILGWIVLLLLASLRPSMDIVIMARCAESGPIMVKRENIFGKVFNFGMEILPGRDADRAIDELGAMINDIQKFGDYGIKKWKKE